MVLRATGSSPIISVGLAFLPICAVLASCREAPSRLAAPDAKSRNSLDMNSVGPQQVVRATVVIEAEPTVRSSARPPVLRVAQYQLVHTRSPSGWTLELRHSPLTPPINGVFPNSIPLIRRTVLRSGSADPEFFDESGRRIALPSSRPISAPDIPSGFTGRATPLPPLTMRGSGEILPKVNFLRILPELPASRAWIDSLAQYARPLVAQDGMGLIEARGRSGVTKMLVDMRRALLERADHSFDDGTSARFEYTYRRNAEGILHLYEEKMTRTSATGAPIGFRVTTRYSDVLLGQGGVVQ